MAKYFLYYAGYNKSNDHEQVGIAVSDDMINWSRPKPDPIIPMGSAGDWNSLQTSNPCVIQHEGKFKMWYQGKAKDNSLCILFADSNDGISWTISQQPVLAIDESIPREPRLGYHHPHVIFDEQAGKFKMWFTKYQNKSSQFCYAESTDGISWNSISDGVLKPEHPWEGNRVFYPCVQKEGETYRMWYTGIKRFDRWAVGQAFSKDGIAWEKDLDNPMLPKADFPAVLKKFFELFSKVSRTSFLLPVYGSASPCVIKDGETYFMLTHNVNNRGKLHIALYESKDGKDWSKKKNSLLDKGTTEWDAFFQGDPYIIKIS
jgi:predicted GH43/DUF377 family glycosyl hydrolase